MTLHLRCKICDFLDVIHYEDGKNWKCPNCELNQPERSKRGDSHINLDNAIDMKCEEKKEMDKKSIKYFMREMTQEELEILSAGSQKNPYAYNLIYRAECNKQQDEN